MMNYIIKDGNAYIIKGDKAHKVEFALDRSMKISTEKEDIIDVKGEKRYTYDQVLRKLNVEYMIAKALEEQNMPVRDEKLLEDIKVLQEEKKALEEKVMLLEKELDELKTEDNNENVDEKPKTEKNK